MIFLYFIHLRLIYTLRICYVTYLWKVVYPYVICFWFHVLPFSCHIGQLSQDAVALEMLGTIQTDGSCKLRPIRTPDAQVTYTGFPRSLMNCSTCTVAADTQLILCVGNLRRNHCTIAISWVPCYSLRRSFLSAVTTCPLHYVIMIW